VVATFPVISRINLLVTLVGIEPTTSSMPWNLLHTDVLIAKDLSSGKAEKAGPKGALCYQFATKFSNRAGRADLWGIGLDCFSGRARVILRVTKVSPRSGDS